MMKLDLRPALAEIRTFLREKIRVYEEYENIGPGDDEDPVQLVSIGFHVEENAFVCIVFDTRPDADVDGEWTMFQEEDNMVFVPEWEEAFDHLCDEGTVSVSLPNGKSKKLDTKDDNDSVARFFGEQIRDVVLEMREGNEFDTLPLAKSAFLSFEEYGGRWGWPAYKQRKKLGRLGS